jgi:hypothetical protein
VYGYLPASATPVKSFGWCHSSTEVPVATQIDTHEQILGKAPSPAQQQATVATQSPAPAVGVERTAGRRLTHDGPTLRDLVGDWTWRSHPDDQQLRPPDAGRESTSTSAQLIRVFARARMLVGY